MQRHNDVCLVKGCGKASHGKPYCAAHLTAGQRRKLSADVSALIRSHCHNAKCYTGDAHEFGEQYCSKCDEACLWKTAAA